MERAFFAGLLGALVVADQLLLQTAFLCQHLFLGVVVALGVVLGYPGPLGQTIGVVFQEIHSCSGRL